MPDWQNFETLDYVSSSAIENVNSGVEELEQIYVGFSTVLDGNFVIQLEMLKDSLAALKESIAAGKEKLHVIQENRDTDDSSGQ